MKKFTLLMIALAALFLLPSMLSGLYAQAPVSNPIDDGIRCGTMQHYAAQVAADPSIELRRLEFEQKLAQWIADHPNGAPDVSVTIPVVVHIVYNTEAQNRTDESVYEQIEIMNTDYAGLNTHSMWSFSNSLKVNTDIQFCLAKQRPDGTPTNGIERRQTSVAGFTSNNDVKHYSTGGLDAWDVTQYINIWVCNLTDYLGYAQFPWSGINSTFGLVVRNTCWGVTGASAPFNLGGTATHELGHCFTLLHIWGDEPACTGSDQCGDTPNQAGATYGFHTGLKTDACSPNSPGIMYMNFMDYSDDAAYANFTPNQKTRIQSCFNSGGYLYSLLSSNKCTSVTSNLVSDVTQATVTDPDWYLFNNNVSYWCAVGVRPNTAGADWDIHMYSDDGFNPPTIASATNGSATVVDFVVMDNNHAPKQSRGIKADRWAGSGTATIEYEGHAESLYFGANTNIDWPAGDVVEMWDIYLTPGTYNFILSFNSGTANLGFALFGSNGTAYYAGRNSAMAIADANGNGIGESFTATITTADYYGLCVFANNANAANFNLNIGVLGQWLGTVSNNWNTAGNWGAGMIPDETIDVNILAGTPYAPVIPNGVSAFCRNLTIGNLATLTQNPTSYFYVYGNFNSDAGTFTQNGSSYLYFAGNTNTWWDDDNEDDTYNNVRVEKLTPTAELTMWQHMTVGTNFAVREGVFKIDAAWTLTVTGTGSTAFEVESGGKLELTTNRNLDIQGGIYFYDGSQADVSGGNIYCGGTFRVNSNTAYDIQFTGGTVILDGSGTQYIQDYDGNTEFYNLKIQKPSGTCYIALNDLNLMNDMWIQSGTLSCTNGPSPTITYNIHVGGDWINDVGPAAFIESTSVVYFDGGNYHQYCDTENFHYLVVNKPLGGAFRLDGTSVTCASYDWTAGAVDVLPYGHFTANDLYDNGIAGNFYLNTNGQIDLTNSNGYVDLFGNLFIYGGNFNVHGGTTMSYWPYSANASITMSGGILDFKDQGIRINSSAYTLTENITGGTIRTAGNLYSYRTDFQPDAGIFMMYGPTDASLYQVAGTNFYHLIINKETVYPAPEASVNPYLNMLKTGDTHPKVQQNMAEVPLLNTVTAASNTDINGDFIISSGVFTAPGIMTVAGNWANYAGLAAFVENTSQVIFDGSAGADVLTQEHFYDLVLDKTFSGFEGLEVSDSISITRDLLITDGTMELNSGAAVHVGRDIIIETDAGLNANDPGPITMYCGRLWIDNNTSFDNFKGFSAGNASRVIFNSQPTVTIQVIKSLNPFNDIVINSQAPWVRPNSPTEYLECENMTIQSGVFRVAGSKVIINNNLDISGELSMISADDSLIVAQDVIWRAGSTDEVEMGKIFCGSDWTFEDGTLAQLDPVNQVIFNSNQTAMILCKDADAAFGSMVINKSAGAANDVYIHGSSSDTLRVSGTMEVLPSNTFHTQSRKMIVSGELDIQSGGEFILTSGYLRNDHNTLYLTGKLAVNQGTVLSKGHVTLPSTGNLIISGGSMTSDPPSGQDLFRDYEGRLELSSGLLEIRNDNVMITNSFNDQISGGTFKIIGAFQANAAGTFQPSGGTVWFGQDYVTAYKTFYCTNGNYFHHLTIDGTMQLESDILVKGNISLLSNNLRATDKTINLNGNWNNNAGTSAFSAMTGKVVFNSGTNHQHCTGNTNFNRLEIDKAFGDLIISTGSTAHCEEYDWTDGELEVNGGTFIADDLVDNGLYGNYYVTALGGLLEVHQDAGQYTDLNGRVVLAGGEMHVYGGNGDSYWPFADDADIWMYGGVLDFKDNGVYLHSSAFFGLNENITGGVIRVNGGFTGLRTDFNPAGGTIELYGTNTGELSHGIGSSLHHVLINKNTTAHVTIPTTGLQINGNLDILDGAVTFSNDLVQVGGDLNIFDGGYLQMLDNAELIMTDGDSLDVYSGGLLGLDGYPGNPAIIRAADAASHYHFNVFSGGTISSEWTNFRNLSLTGVNIHPGATVNSAHAFHFCTFEDGVPGGTLLTINNNQELNVDGASFPPNTWGGASNVSKTVDEGSVYFFNYTGDFSGEGFDNDVYNRINWQLPLSVSAQALPEEICEGSSSQLQAIASDGTPPYTFIWGPATGLSDPSVSNPLATPATTTTYTVTVSDADFNVATASVTVTVNPLPIVTCPPTIEMCLNSTTLFLETLAVSPFSNSLSSVFSGPGVSPSNPGMGWYDFNPLAAGLGTHTITYTYTDINGCSNSCTFDIIVLPQPTVSCPPDISMCITAPALLLSGGTPVGGTYSGPGVTGNTFNPVLAGLGTHTITYTYTDGSGCSNTCTFGITVNPLPIADAGSDVSIMEGNSTTLNGSASGGAAPYAYSWAPAASLSDPLIATPLASPSVTTIYTLTVMDMNGCTDSDEVTVTVTPAGSGTVNGMVNYSNTAFTSLSAVTVNLMQAGLPVYTTITGIGGTFEFPAVSSGTYQVLCSSLTPWGGVNSSDALAVLKHFVGLSSLSGMALVAANVDNFPAVNSIDALMIAKRFTLIITSFPVGDWAFESPLITVTAGASTTQNILGICFGDATQSYIPPYKIPARMLLSSQGSMQAAYGMPLTLPLTTSERLEAGAISLVIDYPEEVMSIAGITAGKQEGNLVYNEVDSSLRIAWYSDKEVVFEAGDAVLLIQATVTGGITSPELTALSESEVVDHQGTPLPDCRLFYPKLNLSGYAYSSSITVHPNPFADFTELQVGTASQAVIEGTLYNAAGMAVQQFRTEVPGAGMHRVVIDGSALAEGYYSCTLTVTEGGKTHLHRLKLVVVR